MTTATTSAGLEAAAGLALTDELRAGLHELYKHLHAHPELSMQEHRTAELIEQRLDGLGIENFRCGGTGVVGVLRNGEGPVVGFRADTDGLPIAGRHRAGLRQHRHRHLGGRHRGAGHARLRPRHPHRRAADRGAACSPKTATPGPAPWC